MPHAGSQVSPPSAATFLSTNRGGGLFSEAVSQRAGSYLALIAFRAGIAPTALTIANLAVAVATSLTVALLAPGIGHGVPSWVVGAAAFVGWQLAYSLDCADGQLARVTGRTSPAGARVDILCDVAVQISFVTAVTAVAVALTPATPFWLVCVFVGTWLVNLMTSILAGGQAAASLITSRSVIVRVVKLVRDYGAMVALFCLTIAVVPAWTVWVMAGFSLTNGGFLAMSIVQSAAAALRAGGTFATSPAKGR